jgi:transcriptional regulator with XRE-family HTH domain
MTPAQCRAARALLHLNQSELATLAGLGLSTVVDFERERRPVSQEVIALLQNALERAGISFREGAVELALHARLSAPTGRLGEKYAHLAEELPWRRLSGAQIRAGRALLRWSAADLARATALGVNRSGALNSRTRKPRLPLPILRPRSPAPCGWRVQRERWWPRCAPS